MKYITATDIKDILLQSGVLRNFYGETKGRRIERVIIDSRSHVRGDKSMFVAIKSNLGDGHRFIEELYRKGVRVFIIQDFSRGLYGNCPDAVFLTVTNVFDALRAIVTVLRQRHRKNQQEILVTGNHGKTTVKELLYYAYKEEGVDVRRSPRSYNSYLGVMLSEIEYYIEGWPDVTITEVGIDGPGQAARLTGNAEGFTPVIHGDVGVLTMVDGEHDEAFEGGRQEKILEMLAVLGFCRKVVYCATDPLVCRLVEENFGGKKELVPVMSNDVCDIADAVITIKKRPESIPSARIDLTAGRNGNELVIDHFTPDRRSLLESMDFVRRLTKPDVLVLGSRISPSDYRAMKALADRHGFKYYPSLETAQRLENRSILLFGTTDRETASLMPTTHETELEVDLEALIHNYNLYRNLVGGRPLVVMVKASAYGLGAVKVAHTLQTIGNPVFAVAVIEEGIALRKAGVTSPVIVLNPITNLISDLWKYKLEPSIFSIEEFDTIHKAMKKLGKLPYHVKLDTGMHRVGFTEEQLPELLEHIAKAKHNPASVFTHLATADCPDKDAYTAQQIEAFRRMSAQFSPRVVRHYLNTAGIMRYGDNKDYEMARLGIGLYGISPLENSKVPLKTVATFRTTVISLKHWPAGTYIGYGNRGVTQRDSIIATIPVGYADGVNRALGCGRASFVVEGVKCPTVGNICMDQCMIDVTDVPGVCRGMKVEIFGTQVSVEELARTLGTIPYEILTSVSPRVRRTYVKN